MSFYKEFRDFALRGNVIDLAIGIIIGAAFTKIVTSLVSDIIMPPVGLLVGGVDFKSLKIFLNDKTTINYGMFITTIVDFILVALAVFGIVKLVNNFYRKEPAPVKACPECLSSIPKDALRCSHCTVKIQELF